MATRMHPANHSLRARARGETPGLGKKDRQQLSSILIGGTSLTPTRAIQQAGLLAMHHQLLSLMDYKRNGHTMIDLLRGAHLTKK